MKGFSKRIILISVFDGEYLPNNPLLSKVRSVNSSSAFVTLISYDKYKFIFTA